MKLKACSAAQLCIDLLKRSTCSVQVAAVLMDDQGIFGWGWNHAGKSGYGTHAEVHAILRSNTHRLAGSTLYVAGRRRKSKNTVLSKPCPDCAQYISDMGIEDVMYRDKHGLWIMDHDRDLSSETVD